MTTYVFPGQGSQQRGMGQGLFDLFPDIVKQADAILGYSIKTLCLEDPQQQLNQTQYTQPALYVVNALNYFKKLQESSTKPQYVAGHSLGEYNALLAANAFDFQSGLKLVQKRGALMSQATGGGMAAIVGLTGEKVNQILQENKLSDISVANYNSYTQIVISGPSAVIGQAQKLFETAGATLVIPLKVSGAFHSPYMQQAREQFEQFLTGFSFNIPAIPVIANLTAKPYESDKVSYTLANQITNSVRWTESIRYLLDKGETDFVEVGPGSVLTGLIRRIKNNQ
jgi:malonyl CoA-acyl carrier protein transacylase